LVWLAAAVALTILAATGSYFVVERYFLSLKDRFANSPATGQEPEA
jgi:peptidoglycan/LPS O-acetylase OafA/YrhL